MQKNLYDKSETASPTVATDPFLMVSSIIIDTFERGDVATTVNIASAYLKAYMKDFTIMKFTGASVDILCEMNPKHPAFVTIDGDPRSFIFDLLRLSMGVCSPHCCGTRCFTPT